MTTFLGTDIECEIVDLGSGSRSAMLGGWIRGVAVQGWEGGGVVTAPSSGVGGEELLSLVSPPPPPSLPRYRFPGWQSAEPSSSISTSDRNFPAQFRQSRRMASDSWSSRLSASSRHYQIKPMSDVFEEADVEDDPKAEFMCPFCAEDFDVLGLCCHVDEEHPVETKNGVSSS
ncbi:Protein DEHYDRATION-INDUCED 19 homolog 6 [Linum grandiflorum]